MQEKKFVRGSKDNRNLVAMRAYKTENNAVIINLYFGTDLANRIGLKSGDRVELYSKRSNRHIVRIKNSHDPATGLKLSYQGCGAFYNVAYTNRFNTYYKLKSTTILSFEHIDNETLEIDLSNATIGI